MKMRFDRLQCHTTHPSVPPEVAAAANNMSLIRSGTQMAFPEESQDLAPPNLEIKIFRDTF